MRKITFIIPLLILILIFGIGFFAISKIENKKKLEEQFAKQEIVDLPALNFKNLFSENDFLTNADFAEKDFSLLNIFASWCISCAAENAILLELAQNKNINIYGIAYHDIDENTKKYLEKNKNPYKKTAIDRRGELNKLLLVKAVPETFIINKKGQIIYRHQAPLDQDFVDFINQLTKVAK